MMHRCMGCMREYDANLSVCPYCNYKRNSKAKEPYYLAPETVLDRKYIVGRVIKSDSFAISYLGWDFENNCSVVIKEYFPKELSSRMPGQGEVNSYDGEKAKQFEAGLKAFIEEANGLKKLSQSLEGTAKVKGMFIENSTAYTVCENFESVSFRQVIDAEGKIPWEDAVRIMLPLIESLGIIHNNGIINFGVYPDNIAMTRDRSMKLLEFNGSRFATVGSNKNLRLITKDGFSAPELYREESDFTAACDVYSVAATLYYAITGIVPPPAIERIGNDKLRPPSQLGIDITPNAENALMNALNLNVAYRTASCSDLLQQIFSEGTVERVTEPRTRSDSGRWSKKAKALVAVAAVVVVSAIAMIFIILGSPKNTESDVYATIKDLSGLTYEQVIEYVTNGLDEGGLGLSADQIILEEEVIPDSVEANNGKIKWQSPGAYSDILVEETDGFVLKIKVAKYDPDAEINAKKKVIMPNICGMTPQQAEDAIKNAGFILSPVKRGSGYSDSVEKGKIYRQSNEKDEEMMAGDQVGYYISMGPKPTENNDGNSKAPSKAPTKRPNTTKSPAKEPVKEPSKAPDTTKAPAKEPVKEPSKEPNITKAPAKEPVKEPSKEPNTTKAPETTAPATTVNKDTEDFG